MAAPLSPSRPLTENQIDKLKRQLGEALRKVNPFSDEAQDLIENSWDEVKDECEQSLVNTLNSIVDRKRAAKDKPVENAWFDLTVDDNMDPMSVVTTAGFDKKDWKYLGPKFSGVNTYRVKLVTLGYVANLDEAKTAAKNLNPKYRLLEGQAREAFKALYPRHNGRPVVFGGSEWQNPSRDRDVAYLGALVSGEWLSNFNWSDNDFNDNCLWAVVEQLSFIPAS